MCDVFDTYGSKLAHFTGCSILSLERKKLYDFSDFPEPPLTPPTRLIGRGQPGFEPQPGWELGKGCRVASNLQLPTPRQMGSHILTNAAYVAWALVSSPRLRTAGLRGLAGSKTHFGLGCLRLRWAFAYFG